MGRMVLSLALLNRGTHHKAIYCNTIEVHYFFFLKALHMMKSSASHPKTNFGKNEKEIETLLTLTLALLL